MPSVPDAAVLIYDGRTAVGYFVADGKSADAYTMAHGHLGRFADRRAAKVAVYEHASPARQEPVASC